MNWESPLDIIVNVIAAGAFLGFLVFVIVYMTFSNWRATAPGRALMYAVGALDLVVLMNTVHLFTGRYMGIEFVRIPVYLILLLSSWRLVWTLIEILHGGQAITVRSFVEPKHKEEATMSNSINSETVPPIWFKAQRVFRTVFTTVLTVLPLIPQVIAIVQGQWDAAWLTAVAAQAVAINAVLTAIIALPAVNAFLTRFGLGSVPRHAVTDGLV